MTLGRCNDLHSKNSERELKNATYKTSCSNPKHWAQRMLSIPLSNTALLMMKI
jgi:hypothetical protein